MKISKYPLYVNGIIEEWLSAGPRRRREALCWLNKKAKLRYLIDIIEDMEKRRECDEYDEHREGE